MPLKKAQRWSQRVTESSNALDLDKGVFTQANPRSIARSLKRSADRSKRRKTDPFRSAMSMLNFYMNRAGEETFAKPTRAPASGEERAAYSLSQAAPQRELTGAAGQLLYFRLRLEFTGCISRMKRGALLVPSLPPPPAHCLRCSPMWIGARSRLNDKGFDKSSHPFAS